MGDRRSQYYKGPQAAGLQARYRDLIANGPAETARPVPTGAGEIKAEIRSIEKLMGNRSSAYWKGPKAEQLQERYRQLLAASRG